MVHLTSIHREFKHRLKVFFVYIREAHLHALADDLDPATSSRDGLVSAELKPVGTSRKEQIELAHRLQKAGLHLPVLIDDQRAEKLYHAWPSRMVFVGRNGNVLWNRGIHNGHDWTQSKLRIGDNSYPIQKVRQWIRQYLQLSDTLTRS